MNQMYVLTCALEQSWPLYCSHLRWCLSIRLQSYRMMKSKYLLKRYNIIRYNMWELQLKLFSSVLYRHHIVVAVFIYPHSSVYLFFFLLSFLLLIPLALHYLIIICLRLHCFIFDYLCMRNALLINFWLRISIKMLVD